MMKQEYEMANYFRLQSLISVTQILFLASWLHPQKDVFCSSLYSKIGFISFFFFLSFLDF